jgi:hypothetical protein
MNPQPSKTTEVTPMNEGPTSPAAATCIIPCVPCITCTARLLLARTNFASSNILFALLCQQLEEEDRQANALGIVEFEAVFAVLSHKIGTPIGRVDKLSLEALFEIHTEWLSDLGVAGPMPNRRAASVDSWLSRAGLSARLLLPNPASCALCAVR